MIVFVCSQGRIRSRTAAVLAIMGGVDAIHCGTDTSAMAPLTIGILREGRVFICMEKAHAEIVKDRLHKAHDPEDSKLCEPKEVISLGVEDVYNLKDEQLISSLLYLVEYRGYPELAQAMKEGAFALAEKPS